MLQITIRTNEVKNGYELAFDAKPGVATRTWLKEKKFRWSPKLQHWWAPRNSDTSEAINHMRKALGATDRWTVIEETVAKPPEAVAEVGPLFADFE